MKKEQNLIHCPKYEIVFTWVECASHQGKYLSLRRPMPGRIHIGKVHMVARQAPVVASLMDVLRQQVL